MVRVTRLRCFKNITDTANGLDHLLRKIFVHLAPQPMDQHIDHVRLRIKTVVPHMFQDHRLGHDPSGLAHEIFEQRLFARLQFDLLAGARYLPAQQIKYEIPHDQLRRFGAVAGPANQCLDTSKQFRKSEWFGQVVVAPRLQAAHAIIDRRFGAEDDYRCPNVFFAQTLNQGQTIEPRSMTSMTAAS